MLMPARPPGKRNSNSSRFVPSASNTRPASSAHPKFAPVSNFARPASSAHPKFVPVSNSARPASSYHPKFVPVSSSNTRQQSFARLKFAPVSNSGRPANSALSILWTLFLAIICLLVVTPCSQGRLHNFASLDVLSDGEVERFIHYNGLTVKETQVNSSDNRESLLLRQMTDGTTFIQLIYTTNNTIKDCEHLKSKVLVRQFLRSFRHSIHSRRKTSPIQSLDGQPLPSYYEKWFSMHKLKHRCNKLHKAIKKMTKRVPNIYDNLIDKPQPPYMEQHYDWKYINSKHKKIHKHLRENTTVPKYLIELPRVGITKEKVNLKPTADPPKVDNSKVTKQPILSFKNYIIPTTTGAPILSKVERVSNTSKTNPNSKYQPNIEKMKIDKDSSNHTEKCRRRKHNHKCSRKVNAKDHFLQKNNSSHKHTIKGHNNNLVTNLNENDALKGMKVAFGLKTTTPSTPNVLRTTPNDNVSSASKNIKALETSTSKITTPDQTPPFTNCTIKYTIKTKGKNVVLNISKPNENSYPTRLPQEPIENSTTMTSLKKVNLTKNSTNTMSNEKVKIRHHHKQNRHFKKKKRKKNKAKNEKVNNATLNVNNELFVTTPSVCPASVNNTVNSTRSPIIVVNPEHSNADSSTIDNNVNNLNNHSQLGKSPPVTIASNESKTVTSDQEGVLETELTNINETNVQTNRTYKTDESDFDDLNAESSHTVQTANTYSVNNSRTNANKTNSTTTDQDKFHVYRKAPEESSALERVKDGFSNLMLVPGTKWCGVGNGATRYSDLGSFSSTDLCCRKHDSCRLTIPGFGRKYNYFNFKPFTLSYCGCDHRFRTCLKLADSGAANLVGKLFFNVIQTKCFVLRPDKQCTKRSWWGKCLTWETGHRAEVRDNYPY
uniref:phospholipase A2 n=1 Tax=Cacopsylla melanoneura TaxID=428564 RepID=A0A8D8QW17_9HEMI